MCSSINLLIETSTVLYRHIKKVTDRDETGRRRFGPDRKRQIATVIDWLMLTPNGCLEEDSVDEFAGLVYLSMTLATDGENVVVITDGAKPLTKPVRAGGPSATCGSGGTTTAASVSLKIPSHGEASDAPAPSLRYS